MNRTHAPAGLAGLIGGVALVMLGVAAIAGNTGKYLAQYSHINSAPHSPVRDADASGEVSLPVRPPLAIIQDDE